MSSKDNKGLISKNQQSFFYHQKHNEVINQEQIAQIVEAIGAGKYSWACVLLLRFIDHDPSKYIPYNTYNRLIKQNCHVGNSHKTDNLKAGNQ